MSRVLRAADLAWLEREFFHIYSREWMVSELMKAELKSN